METLGACGAYLLHPVSEDPAPINFQKLRPAEIFMHVGNAISSLRTLGKISVGVTLVPGMVRSVDYLIGVQI